MPEGTAVSSIVSRKADARIEPTDNPGKYAGRSGYAITHVLERIKWMPDVCFQVGVGGEHPEAIVMKKMWPDIELIGCEPLSHNFAKALLYPGELYHCAMLDKPGIKKLWTKRNHKDGSSFFKPLTEGAWQEEVRVATLDTLWLPIVEMCDGRNVMLWVDAEGTERQVLAGGTEFLRYVGCVNIEMTGRPPTEEEGWSKPVEIHNILLDAGFFRLWCHTQRSNGGQCDSVYVRQGMFKPEYCCCPCEIERWERLGLEVEDGSRKEVR